MISNKKEPTNEELNNVVNYLSIKWDWNRNLILPYEDGIKYLSALEKAEMIEIPNWDQPDKIKFISMPTISTKIISQKEYREAKIKALFGEDNENT